jgi:hypothetical protein
MDTCRDEILAAIVRLERESPDGTVSPQDVVDALARMGSRYPASTIRTHVTSKMCADTPEHHARVYDDLERVGRGRYRLRRQESAPTAEEGQAFSCLCGCGQFTLTARAIFRPGHDARMASQVARDIRTDPKRAEELLATLPSEALRAKVRAMVPRPASSVTGLAPPADFGHLEGERLKDIPAGDSTEQREAEAVILDVLARNLGLTLTPMRLHLPDGSYVDVDGVGDEPPTLVEVWAHQGPPKVAQRNKVLSDALKVAHVSRVLDKDYRLILCFSDVAAAKPFLGRSWYAGALRTLGIDVHIVTLSDEWVQRIMEAQRRQYR